jgi:hypothetical protein
MVLCIEPYSPGGATKLLFKERFRTTAHGLKLQVEINNGFEWGGGGIGKKGDLPPAERSRNVCSNISANCTLLLV